MSVHEPMTVATDYLLAIIVTILGLRLLAAGAGHRSRRFWACSFLASAAAAFLGGSWHGFHGALPAVLNAALWKATMVTIGVGSVCLALGAITSRLESSNRRILQFLLLISLVAYVGWVVGFDDDFKAAIVIYGLCMMLVGVLMLVRFSSDRRMASWVFGGVGVWSCAAAIQQSGFGIHPQFNHNDLYHLVQIAGFLCFYHGGLLMRDRCEERGVGMAGSSQR